PSVPSSLRRSTRPGRFGRGGSASPLARLYAYCACSGVRGAAMSTSTPWGLSQTTTRHAPGITFYSTASHGGFHLSAGRLAQVHPAMRELSGYPAGWFEEDCDWAVVGLHFPAELVT